MRYFIALIIGIGCVIFSNSLTNSFIWDDKSQIIQAAIIHSAENIPLLFITSISNPQGSIIDPFNYFYRPLMFVFFNILYSLGGGQVLYFHIFQIFLYIINAILLLYFFKSLFSKGFAFLLSLIFLVHPANETTAVGIAYLQDPLFFFFGISALLLLKVNVSLSWMPVIVVLLLFLSLLSKETGILFVCVVLLYVFLFQKRLLGTYAKLSIIMLFIYTILRIIASRLYFLYIIDTAVIPKSLVERLATTPKIFYFYIHEIFVPTETISVYGSSLRATASNIVNLYLFVSISFLLILFIIGRIVWKKKRDYFRYYLFFLIWFFLGIGINLQIFKLEQVVAKRWIYFPLAGFLGLIGVFINAIGIKSKRWVFALLVLTVFIIVTFSIQTWKMNFYWKNEKIANTHTQKY
jgi:hypothetical protein